MLKPLRRLTHVTWTTCHCANAAESTQWLHLSTPSKPDRAQSTISLHHGHRIQPPTQRFITPMQHNSTQGSISLHHRSLIEPWALLHCAKLQNPSQGFSAQNRAQDKIPLHQCNRIPTKASFCFARCIIKAKARLHRINTAESNRRLHCTVAAQHSQSQRLLFLRQCTRSMTKASFHTPSALPNVMHPRSLRSKLELLKLSRSVERQAVAAGRKKKDHQLSVSKKNKPQTC